MPTVVATYRVRMNVERPPNRGRQWRAQRSCASPLHAGLDVRVDAAMAGACGRDRRDSTRALVVFAGRGDGGGMPMRRRTATLGISRTPVLRHG